MHFRIRRGKLVEIPSKFVGRITTRETKRQRRMVARIKVLKRKSRLLQDERFAFKTQEVYERGQFESTKAQSGGNLYGVFQPAHYSY